MRHRPCRYGDCLKLASPRSWYCDVHRKVAEQERNNREAARKRLAHRHTGIEGVPLSPLLKEIEEEQLADVRATLRDFGITRS